MKDIMDFLSAALPWISIGLLLAIFFVQSARKKKDKKKNDTYGTEGMALGMCFGTAISTAFGNNTGIGLPLGMLAGLVIGSCIEKKKNDGKRETTVDSVSDITCLEKQYVRPLLPDEIPEAIDLIWEVFLKFEAPVYSEEGIRTFRASLDDPVRTASLKWYGAFENGHLAGILCMRAPQHIADFFVKESCQGNGHGRRLFERMQQDYERKEFTVNSSPYAVPIYRKLGFCPAGEEQTVDGLRFTPMVYKK